MAGSPSNPAAATNESAKQSAHITRDDAMRVDSEDDSDQDDSQFTFGVLDELRQTEFEWLANERHRQMQQSKQQASNQAKPAADAAAAADQVIALLSDDEELTQPSQVEIANEPTAKATQSPQPSSQSQQQQQHHLVNHNHHDQHQVQIMPQSEYAAPPHGQPKTLAQSRPPLCTATMTLPFPEQAAQLSAAVNVFVNAFGKSNITIRTSGGDRILTQQPNDCQTSTAAAPLVPRAAPQQAATATSAVASATLQSPASSPAAPTSTASVHSSLAAPTSPEQLRSKPQPQPISVDSLMSDSFASKVVLGAEEANSALPPDQHSVSVEQQIESQTAAAPIAAVAASSSAVVHKKRIGGGGKKKTTKSAPVAPAARQVNQASVPPGSPLASGRTDEYTWINTVDTVNPTSLYLHLPKMHLHHPSVRINQEASHLSHCACRDGKCKASSCLCSQSTTVFYDPRSRVKGIDKVGNGYITECNHLCSCACNPSTDICFNRVVQLKSIGVRIQLQVYKTRHKGWAVRTMKPIGKGEYICEYLGELISERLAELRGSARDSSSAYLFTPATDLITGGKWELSNDLEPFSIDAYAVGNVARFLNHSCDSNCLAFQVFIECQEALVPRIAFYASRAIEAGEELTIDYQHSESVKLFDCQCDPCLLARAIQESAAASAYASLPTQSAAAHSNAADDLLASASALLPGAASTSASAFAAELSSKQSARDEESID